jgi:TFIIF-interacting CTD phosphatase-like protein
MKINLFLDLDETLEHSFDISGKKTMPIYIENFVHHNFEKTYVVMERPNLQKFLDWAFKNFNVSIWSAGQEEYVKFIVENIIEKSKKRKLNHVLHSKDCDNSELNYDGHIKKLDMLWKIYKFPGYTPENTILIDDLSSNTFSQENNSIRIPKFNGKGGENDTKLIELQAKLQIILDNYKTKHKIVKSPKRKTK